ncbi:MAG TPA: cellulase N-terminal Ig-like domain-containing protein, partial [Candidatus Paceibacterota bacterium]|nr:cellulase N-terminal Ig-like domain-containing protein [Candidatus Paceibacterota bacterium]
MKTWIHLPKAVLLVCLPTLCLLPAITRPATDPLHIPQPGDHELIILSPTLLELVLINSKEPDAASVGIWDWVDNAGNFVSPSPASLTVIVAGHTNAVTATGFKRRPIYVPQANWDLRIGNHLFLQLNDPIADGQPAQVINDGTLWPTNITFSAAADPLRENPAIHVNQEGYLPAYPKKAIVGYYLGDMGEMTIPTNAFFVVDAQSGATLFQGTLNQRSDFGYTYTPTPYQNVFEADFSSVTTPGSYRLVVPGMGASLPFRIDERIGMDFARTYALGLFHQRSGFDVAMPFTRFTHAADHLTPATVPTNTSAPFAFTWNLIAANASEVDTNTPQAAPLLTDPSAQLFPFVNQGPVDVSGGHFEAGDYNRVTYNSAQLIHTLMFAVDALPGVAALDNLGIPESGDGISDVLQEAKWEADFLAKLQDADGGF